MKKFIPALLAVAAIPAFFAGAAPLQSVQAACCCGEACKCEDCKCTSSSDEPCTCNSSGCCVKKS